MSHGEATNRLIHQILYQSKQPSTDEKAGPVDVQLLTGTEAAEKIESGSVSVPIITHRQQVFYWGKKSRPISELFLRMEIDPKRSVSVQIPSRPCTKDSYETRKLAEVRDRFLSGQDAKPDDPWNVLDLRSPVPAATLPKFLHGENSQLLPRVRDAVLMGGRAERAVARREEWNEWRDVLEWVLLAEGGHNTAPHTDSHGFGSWITVQEGHFGFGWMSRPTPEEREQWMADPQNYTGGQWRYAVLDPDQTIFFNPGTIHFVFRLKGKQTLALGGHVILWSDTDDWIKVVIDQVRNPNMTNEEVQWSAPKYVRVVADLVANRIKNRGLKGLGNEENIRRFFDSANVRLNLEIRIFWCYWANTR
jgi:hypothetical protein